MTLEVEPLATGRRKLWYCETGNGWDEFMGLMDLRQIRRGVWALLCLLGGAVAALAAPERYVLDKENSVVGFTYYLSDAGTEGVMPVASADLLLDLQDVRRSKIDVTLSPAQAKAGFIFATEALKGARVLDVSNHPTIRFVAREISGTIHGAQVTGDLTIRGVTRPVTLAAQLFRQRGTEAGDLNNLSILLTGQLDRRVFGAVGYPDLVGPNIDLRILARVTKDSR
ncbi:YceI family protein [Shimia sp. R11_0]|uniref:YceI family protein n=1 Tax=Shimia sp. R11_0 TaxID=2821096 RepID=UPI0032AEC7FF